MGCPCYKGLFVKKVSLGKQNLTPTFIGSWSMSPLSICDDLIAYFESNQKNYNFSKSRY